MIEATVRPGTDRNGGFIMVVWIRINLGDKREWIPVGTIGQGWK
jgi:hypothetical protein